MLKNKLNLFKLVYYKLRIYCNSHYKRDENDESSCFGGG